MAPTRLAALPSSTPEEAALAVAATALGKRAAVRGSGGDTRSSLEVATTANGGGDERVEASEDADEEADGNLIAKTAGIEYRCNVDVLCLMLREGYVERRVGTGYARLLSALIDAHYASASAVGRRSPSDTALGREEAPLFLIRVLAEAAWRCVRTLRVRAGARLGRDSKLADVRARLAVLGPDSLAALKADLLSPSGSGSEASA